MLRTLVLTGAALLGCAASATAEDSAPSASAQTKSVAKDNESEIVVVADANDQKRIDRRTYTIKDDAEAQTTDMFEILSRIPSVAVSPDGEISLLGASGVEVQINGQPVPGGQSLEQILRGLPGSQVKRIEIITNPPAQFSAAASGGIINIITKDRFDIGVSASLRVDADTFGGRNVNFAPSFSREKWSLNAWAGTFRGGEDRDASSVRNYLPNGPNERRIGANGFGYDGWYAESRASYSPTEKRRFSVSLGGDSSSYGYHERLDVTNDAGLSAVRTTRNDSRNDYRHLDVEWQADGKEERALTKVKLSLGRNVSPQTFLNGETIAGAAGPGLYRTTQDNEEDTLTLKLDAERPRPGDRFLTWGASVDARRRSADTALDILKDPGPAPYEARLEGEDRTLAAYATYQFDVGDWTFLPGARVEDYWRDYGPPGGKAEDEDARLFPSVHLRKKLSERVNLDLSYTARIQRPGLEQLDPTVRFAGDYAFSGNPSLEPTTVDAYEANINYQKDKLSLSATFFDRISHDVVGNRNQLIGGVIYSRPVNAGENEDRGLQTEARGPLGSRWSYTLSANALQRAYDALKGGDVVRREVAQYSGNARLDYRDLDQDAIGANQLQFFVDFQGPTYDLQTKREALATANVTWRRRLTKDVVGVLSAYDIFASRIRTSETTTDNYYERSTRDSPGVRWRLALTYQFGAKRDQQDQPGPPTPGGGR